MGALDNFKAEPALNPLRGIEKFDLQLCPIVDIVLRIVADGSWRNRRARLEIAAWVGGVPLPGGLEDGVEGGELRGPGEFAADFAGAGDQDCGIAGAARGVDGRDGFAGNARGGGDDLADAGAGADAEIVDMRSGSIE